MFMDIPDWRSNIYQSSVNLDIEQKADPENQYLVIGASTMETEKLHFASIIGQPSVSQY